MAEFMHDYHDKIKAGDWQGAAAYYHDDIVAHQSGRGAWSGTFKGKQAVLDWLNEATSMLDSMQIEYHALTMGEGHAVILNRLSATKGDKSYSGNRVVVYHLGEDKITELWAIDEDQAAFDEFVS